MSEAILDDTLLFWLSALLLAWFLMLLTTAPPFLLSGLMWSLLLLLFQLLSGLTDMLRLLRPLRNVPYTEYRECHNSVHCLARIRELILIGTM
jgi:hypothetical protein